LDGPLSITFSLLHPWQAKQMLQLLRPAHTLIGSFEAYKAHATGVTLSLLIELPLRIASVNAFG
jgi:hypothetical protein